MGLKIENSEAERGLLSVFILVESFGCQLTSPKVEIDQVSSWSHYVTLPHSCQLATKSVSDAFETG